MTIIPPATKNNNEVTITIQVGNGRSVVKTLTETEAIALGLVTAKPKAWKPKVGDMVYSPFSIPALRYCGDDFQTCIE